MSIETRVTNWGALHPLAADLFDEVARVSPAEHGVSRPAYSTTETKALDVVKAFAESHGLSASRDAFGNLTISLPEDAQAERFRLVGSHIDSVPEGGNFDGLAGIVAGLLCLIEAKSTGTCFSRPTKVLALRGEESAWFGPCYIGSKSLLGALKKRDLDAKHRGDGRTLAEHMRDIGIDTTPIADGRPLLNPATVEAFIEIHIEQGPVLVEAQKPLALVSGIRGNIRFPDVVCRGEAGHSGAVPRQSRHDAVLATAALLTQLDEVWQTVSETGGDLALTSGILHTDATHHAMSRIPDEVRFSLDIRSAEVRTLDAMERLVAQEARTIAEERGVAFDFCAPIRTPPATLDQALLADLAQAGHRLDMEPDIMPSGAGHDAAVFATAGIASGMIFVRNRNGSHNPNEEMELDDLLAATALLYSFLTSDL